MTPKSALEIAEFIESCRPSTPLSIVTAYLGEGQRLHPGNIGKMITHAVQRADAVAEEFRRPDPAPPKPPNMASQIKARQQKWVR